MFFGGAMLFSRMSPDSSLTVLMRNFEYDVYDVNNGTMGSVFCTDILTYSRNHSPRRIFLHQFHHAGYRTTHLHIARSINVILKRMTLPDYPAQVRYKPQTIGQCTYRTVPSVL